MKKILILSANPTDTERLRLDEEVREIQVGLERAKIREQFEIITKWAVRPDDLRRSLLDHNPQIIHFSGHGGGNQGLALADNTGKVQALSSDSLSTLFSLFQGIECVLLNACYSEVQAEAIRQHINYVVGMNQAIGDQAAIKFAVGFYDALGAGRSYEDAYKFGCVSIALENIPESATPVLKQRDKPINTEQVSQAKRVFISYKRNVEPDESVALQVFQALAKQHQVFVDQTMLVGTRWAESIEAEIRQADFLITFLSAESVHSEMVEAEIKMAHNLAQLQGGKPAILPVRLKYRQPFQYPLSAYLNDINWAFWQGQEDTPRLITELSQAICGGHLSIGAVQAKAEILLQNPPSILPRPFPSAQPVSLEMPEGTMECDSKFYIERSSDFIALEAIRRQGVTITIKGPRQMGKSSLLIRTADAAVGADKQVATNSFANSAPG